MFEFFLALFGGIYWGSKCINEKHQKRKYNYSKKQSRIIDESITATKEEEINLKNSLLSENRLELLQSIAPELSEIYGDTWYREFSDTSDFDTQYNWIEYPWGTAFNLLLAKKGLKPRMSGYYYDLSGGGDITERKVKVCKLIEKNIQTLHPELRMIFIPGNKSFDDYTFYEEIYMGELWWEHNATFLGGKYKIPTRYLW